MSSKFIFLKSFVTGLIVMVFCVNSTAQQQQSIDKISQAMTDSLSYLQLNDQQKTSAVNLNKVAATSLVQLAEKAKLDTTLQGKAGLKQVMMIMKKRNDGLGQLLTPDQKKLFDQRRVSQLADLQTKAMKVQLNLTDQQVQQVYALNLKQTEKMMHGVSNLKSAEGKLEKAKAAKSLKSESEDKDKEMKKILNPDQYSKYEKVREANKAALKEKMEQQKK